jgi:hypothetical protein
MMNDEHADEFSVDWGNAGSGIVHPNPVTKIKSYTILCQKGVFLSDHSSVSTVFNRF